MKVIDIIGKYKKGFVYFVRAGFFGPIKIGFTTNIPKRMYQLQTGCPDKIQLLGSIKTNQGTEEALHERFKATRLEGEWFLPNEKILSVINDMLEEEKEHVYYDPEIDHQWEGMNKKQWDSWNRFKSWGYQR